MNSIILRVAYEHRSAFEWGQHVKMALAAGVTQAEIDRISREPTVSTGNDELVLTATDELIGSGTVSAATWDRLVAELDTHQAMEVIFVVGAYITTGMAFGTWGLAPLPGTAPLPATHDQMRTSH